MDGWLRGEATRFGVSRRGAFAAYFADHDRWHLQTGQKSIGAFTRTTATGGRDTRSKSLPETMAEHFVAARVAAAGFVGRAEAAAALEKPVKSGHRIKLKVDAMLDTLIFKLERP